MSDYKVKITLMDSNDEIRISHIVTSERIEKSKISVLDMELEKMLEKVWFHKNKDDE